MSSKRYQVRNHDSVFRFRVTSNTRPDIEHVVDVSEHNGIGECSCEHFQFRLAPAIKNGLASRRASRCSHIVAAREACLDSLIQRITGAADAAEREGHETNPAERLRDAIERFHRLGFALRDELHSEAALALDAIRRPLEDLEHHLKR